MKLVESRILKLAGLLKEDRTQLNEEDKKFYAEPDWVMDQMERAWTHSKKKFKEKAKKGYLTYKDVQLLFNTFGHGGPQGTGWAYAPNAKSRELRKKFGSPEEQDKKR